MIVEPAVWLACWGGLSESMTWTRADGWSGSMRRFATAERQLGDRELIRCLDGDVGFVRTSQSLSGRGAILGCMRCKSIKPSKSWPL